MTNNKFIYSFLGDVAEGMGGMVTGALDSITGGLTGMIFQGEQDANQVSQQQKLTNIQQQSTEAIQDHSMQDQLQLWQQTNYPAQVQEAEAAGLNPAMLYAKGGAGGTTGVPTGGAGMGIASPVNPVGQGMALQTAETMADIKLKDAQANNIAAKTPQEAGLMNAETLNLTQGVSNQQAQEALTKVQTAAQGIQTQIQGKTIDDQIAAIRAAASTAQQQFQIIERNNWLDQATLKTKVDQANANLIGTYITNNLQKSNIQVNQEQIQQMANQIVQSRAQTSINLKNANTQDAQQQTNDSLMQLQKLMFSYNMDQNAVNQVMEGVKSLIPSLILAQKPGVTNYNTTENFH